MAKNTRDKKSRARQSVNKGPRTTQPQRAGKKTVMVFARQNYLLMILGIVLVFIGYYIMRMENEVDGFISLYVAPIIILGGYLEIVYAILWRPREQPESSNKPEVV